MLADFDLGPLERHVLLSVDSDYDRHVQLALADCACGSSGVVRDHGPLVMNSIFTTLNKTSHASAVVTETDLPAYRELPLPPEVRYALELAVLDKGPARADQCVC